MHSRKKKSIQKLQPPVPPGPPTSTTHKKNYHGSTLSQWYEANNEINETLGNSDFNSGAQETMNNGTGHASSSTDETLSNGSHEASRDSNKFDYSKDQKNSAIISNGAINSNGAIDSNGVINSNSGHDSNYTKEEQNNGNFECICLDVWNRKACQAYAC